MFFGFVLVCIMYIHNNRKQTPPGHASLHTKSERGCKNQILTQPNKSSFVILGWIMCFYVQNIVNLCKIFRFRYAFCFLFTACRTQRRWKSKSKDVKIYFHAKSSGCLYLCCPFLVNRYLDWIIFYSFFYFFHSILYRNINI